MLAKDRARRIQKAAVATARSCDDEDLPTTAARYTREWHDATCLEQREELAILAEAYQREMRRRSTPRRSPSVASRQP